MREAAGRDRLRFLREDDSALLALGNEQEAKFVDVIQDAVERGKERVAFGDRNGFDVRRAKRALINIAHASR